MSISADKPVLLFDGVCNLCNRWVNFVIDRDPEGRIMFAPLQSDPAKQLLEEHRLDPGAMDTVVLIDDGRAFDRSEAVLRIAAYLKGPVRLLRIGRILPKKLRDALYNLVAHRRYHWFGKRDECRIPEPGLKDRFLEMSPAAEGPAGGKSGGPENGPA
jgi:predicted DCC family thiol-disulfide oxidoreductase YuxK